MNGKTNFRIIIKGLIITGLTLVLLIPALLINNLVYERQSRLEEASKEISSKWAGKQTITGPILTIPYMQYDYDTNGKQINQAKKYIHILPDQLSIKGNIVPEKRYRGIFEVVVYGARLNFSGSFSNILSHNLQIPKENILYDQAFVSIGITDLRGIKDNIIIDWHNKLYSFYPGMETSDIIESGISTPVKISTDDEESKNINFSYNVNLKGSQNLRFTPVGKETKVSLSSNWQNPSFDGAYLPDSRDVSSNGFTADWKILQLNRDFPQSWLNNSYSVKKSEFGINLILAVDNYTQTDRSVKYAILFIALTFLTFFFLEILNNKSIHPVQYALIGFALVIYYILLLSISEHTSFNIAYLISTILTIGLVWLYSKSILGEKRLASLVGGTLIILYGFIFTIIQLEDYALLMGSLGLFLILGAVMYYSRKVDWKLAQT